MNNSKKLKIFYKEIRKYFNIISKDESYFHSSKAKTLRSYLINLKSEIESELNELIGNNLLIEINSNYHVNILTGAFSEDYKKSVYCLEKLIESIKSVKVDKKEGIENGKNGLVNKIIDLISQGEGRDVEFKASMIYPVEIPPQHPNKPNDKFQEEIKLLISDVRREILITITAFANGNGGDLIIGVKDDGKIAGIESDIKKIPGEKQNQDGYSLFFESLIKSWIGVGCLFLVKINFINLKGKLVLRVNVDKSKKPIYLKEQNGGKSFYVRSINSSEKLNTEEAIEYIRDHWKK